MWASVCDECDENDACLSFAVYRKQFTQPNLEMKICWRFHSLSSACVFPCHRHCCWRLLRNANTSLDNVRMCFCSIFFCIFFSFRRKAIYCNSCWKAITNFRFEASPLGISHFCCSLSLWLLSPDDGGKKITRDEHLMTHIQYQQQTIQPIPFSFWMTQKAHIKSAREFVKIKLNKSDPHRWHWELSKWFWFVGQSTLTYSHTFRQCWHRFIFFALSFQYCCCLHWY